MKYLLTILALLFVAACAPGAEVAIENNNNEPNQSSEDNNSGEVFVTVTDAAADMGAISEIELTVDKVEFRNEQNVWVDVDAEPQTYALIELKEQGAQELFAQAELAAGTYDRMRVTASQAVIIDNEGRHEAAMPTNTFEFDGNLQVNSNAQSTATFDFIADESTHVTQEGDYVFAAVVEVTTRSNAQASVASNNRVTISGGNTDDNFRVGTDINGNVGVGLSIPADAVLSLEGSLGGVLDGALGGSLSIVGSAQGSAESEGSASGSGSAQGSASGSAQGSIGDNVDVSGEGSADIDLN